MKLDRRKFWNNFTLESSKYNPQYQKILTSGIPIYLLHQNGLIRTLARFRCGNEKRGKITRRNIRLCEEEETIEQMLSRCEAMRSISKQEKKY